jgi:hypothetical protein
MREPGLDLNRSIFLIVLIAICIFVAIVWHFPGIFASPAGKDGVLTGNVTIGPLCPVEPCEVDPGLLLAAYNARQIIVTTTTGEPAGSVTPDPVLGYSFHLRPGVYIIDTSRTGVDYSPDVPATVTVSPGVTTRHDIHIDTGIR